MVYAELKSNLQGEGSKLSQEAANAISNLEGAIRCYKDEILNVDDEVLQFWKDTYIAALKGGAIGAAADSYANGAVRRLRQRMGGEE